LAIVSPVDVHGTAEFVTDDNMINIEVTADFYGPVSDRQFTVSAVVVEDGVTGTGPEWAQANAYSGGGFGPMGGFENMPDPVPASDLIPTLSLWKWRKIGMLKIFTLHSS